MSKTINPASYTIIYEWAFELLLREEEFSIDDIMEHVPMSEYTYEDNFEDLYSLMSNYAIDVVTSIAEEHGLNKNLCVDLNNEEDDIFEDDGKNVKADTMHRLNIPKYFVEKLLSKSKNLCLGCFGNEVMICDVNNPELKNAKSIIFKEILKYWHNSPYIRMDFRQYFNNPSDEYFVFYDEPTSSIHILSE